MRLSELLLTNLGVIAGAMLFLWLISIPIKNASIVDVFWGPAFAMVALVGWFLGDGDHDRRTLLAALTAAWGFRLGMYLALRNLGHGEAGKHLTGHGLPRARLRRRLASHAGG